MKSLRRRGQQTSDSKEKREADKNQGCTLHTIMLDISRDTGHEKMSAARSYALEGRKLVLVDIQGLMKGGS